MSDKKGNEGGFCKFLYNKDTGEVLGRTGMSWVKIIVFYIIFYAGLAAFFGLMLYIFYLTLDIEKPKYRAEESLIGTNPGVGFRPQPDQDANVDSTLIWFSKSKPADYQFWSKQLGEYIDTVNAVKESDVQTCTFATGAPAEGERACKVEVQQLGPCIAANDFGYKFGEPCVLIKLNRIFDWKPERYGDKNFDETRYLASLENNKLPVELRGQIAKLISQQSDNDAKKRIAESVWISCTGENPADRENIGVIDYYPMAGIPSYYFPFKKQPGYQSPFVMVHFSRVTPGVLVNIECKAWAANIHPDRQTRTGSVHFELMVD